ncbi:MAG: hypothetical protein K2O43_01455, partial [Muribaculaceae bacterium]|nr:hypothetical protein [Muribaculaceae bacterium]
VEDAPKTTPVADTPKDEAVDSTEPVQPDVKVQPSEKVYKIQFLTSSKKLNETAPELKGLNNVDFYMDHNVYKYTYGSYAKKEEAQAELNNIRKTFKEAFVVALRDGKRVDL